MVGFFLSVFGLFFFLILFAWRCLLALLPPAWLAVWGSVSRIIATFMVMGP